MSKKEKKNYEIIKRNFTKFLGDFWLGQSESTKCDFNFVG